MTFAANRELLTDVPSVLVLQLSLKVIGGLFECCCQDHAGAAALSQAEHETMVMVCGSPCASTLGLQFLVLRYVQVLSASAQESCQPDVAHCGADL